MVWNIKNAYLAHSVKRLQMQWLNMDISKLKPNAGSTTLQKLEASITYRCQYLQQFERQNIFRIQLNNKMKIARQGGMWLPHRLLAMSTVIHSTTNHRHPLASPITMAVTNHRSNAVFPVEETPCIFRAQPRSGTIPRRRMHSRGSVEDMIQPCCTAWNDAWPWRWHFTWPRIRRLRWLGWDHIRWCRSRKRPVSCRRKIHRTCRWLHRWLATAWIVDRHAGMLDQQVFQWARGDDGLLGIPDEARRRCDQPALFHAWVDEMLGLWRDVTQSSGLAAHWPVLVIISQQQIAGVDVRAAVALEVGRRLIGRPGANGRTHPSGVWLGRCRTHTARRRVAGITGVMYWFRVHVDGYWYWLTITACSDGINANIVPIYNHRILL